MCQGFIQFILVLIQQVAKFHPIGLVRHVSRFHPVDKVGYLFEESSLSPVVVVVVAIPFGDDSAFESFLGGGFLLKEINAVGARNEHLVLCFANQIGKPRLRGSAFFFSLLKIRACLCVWCVRVRCDQFYKIVKSLDAYALQASVCWNNPCAQLLVASSSFQTKHGPGAWF